MKKHHYSYNAQLILISRLFVLSAVIIVLIGIFLSIELYNQQVTIWVVQNEHNGGTSIDTNPISTNPSIINSTSSVSIPYSNILINNAVIIFLVPFIFIACFLFISRKVDKLLIKKETDLLIKSVGVIKINSEQGYVALNTKEKLRVTIGKDRLFKLENCNINTQITGDELYWNIKNLKYKKTNE